MGKVVWDRIAETWDECVGQDPHVFVAANRTGKNLRSLVEQKTRDPQCIRLCLARLAEEIGRPGPHAGIVGTMSPARWLESREALPAA